MNQVAAPAVSHVEVLGGVVEVTIRGGGPPLVLLPRENIPVSTFLVEQLSRSFTLYTLTHPGFAGPNPQRWEWMRDVRDLAIVEGLALTGLGLERAHLLGLGLGGWVAAEMAVMAPFGVDSLALVSPMGVRPADGQIFDQFLVNAESYARAAFQQDEMFDAAFGQIEYEQLEAWETAREMASRLTWRPYMYDPVLPRLLPGLQVPTVLIAGERDRVVPRSSIEAYHHALPGSSLLVLPEAGHAVDWERADVVAASVTSLIHGATQGDSLILPTNSR